MSSHIYYFSGTGNALSVARKISALLENSELHSISQTIDTVAPIETDVLGIVCPIYMYNMPVIVADFIGKIKRSNYIFMVFAGEGELGNGLRATKSLFSKNNLKLSSLFNIKMPGNYTPYGYPDVQHQKILFEQAKERIQEIVNIVSAQKEHQDTNNTSFFKANIHPGIFYALGYTQINKLGQTFTVDETCNSCGICAKVCPVNNIALINGHPQWGMNCQFCYACLQWCPQEAIQNGRKTRGVKRYHHPDITLADIINSTTDTD